MHGDHGERDAVKEGQPRLSREHLVADPQIEREAKRHRRHDDIKLTVADKDFFTGEQWFFQQVRFARDKDGRILGFRLTGSRVLSYVE